MNSLIILSYRENIDISNYIIDYSKTELIIVGDVKANSNQNNIQTINIEQANTAYSMNQGISQAKGNYIVICGARSFINQSYIDQCVAMLEKDKTIGCVGGTISHAGKSTKGKSIARAMGAPLGMGLMSFRSKKSSGFVDTVSVPVFRKSIFNEVGYFDEAFIRNQDEDMSFRIQEHGYSIWMDNAISSTYFVREKLSQLMKQFFQYGFWKNYVNQKHRTVITLRQLAPPLFILILLGSLLLLPVLPVPLLVIEILSYTILFGLYSLYLNSFNPVSSFYSFVAFICMHCSYGVGYLFGFVYVFVLGKTPPSFVKTITR